MRLVCDYELTIFIYHDVETDDLEIRQMEYWYISDEAFDHVVELFMMNIGYNPLSFVILNIAI